jgi:glucose/arabinose dehydrogenase
MRRHSATAFCLLLLVVLASGFLAETSHAAHRRSASAAPPFRLVQIARAKNPTYIAQPKGDPRLFIVEQGGRILVLRNGRIQARPFLDLHGKLTSGGEQGLLSVAFHPQFASNGRLFVDFTDEQGDTRIWEYHARPGAPTVDGGPPRELMHIAQPYPNHNGGQLQFGPDGDLYIGMGDGGSADDPQRRGQDLGTPLAKLLRIDVDHRTGSLPYAIPADNPFRGVSGALPEIYSYGLRNPWRFSFDRQTGALVIGDVGQDHYEEIDAVARGGGRGANFGWNHSEGLHAFPGGAPLNPAGRLVRPVAEYSHALGCSVTGGYVYRGSLIPSLRGRYLYADYCSGHLWSLRISASGKASGLVSWTSAVSDAHAGQIVSFGEDQRGELYVVSQTGQIYAVRPR